MDKHGVPQGLRKRVQHNLHYQLHKENRLDPELFAALSPAVQRELSLTLLSSTVLRFPLFKGAQHGFIAELAQAHIWVSCLPGDMVVEEGQLMEEMVFLVHGRLLVHHLGNSADPDEGEHSIPLNIQANDGDEHVEYEVGQGAWFGETCLFAEGCVHKATVAAVNESELAVLPAREFRRIAERFPRLQERHRQLQAALAKKEVSIAQLAYQSTDAQAPGRSSVSIFKPVTLLRRSQCKVMDSSWTLGDEGDAETDSNTIS